MNNVLELSNKFKLIGWNEMTQSEKRAAYLAEVEKFSSSSDPVIVSPVRLGGSDISGWTVSRGEITLSCARGGPKVFKSLSVIVSLCSDIGAGEFLVTGL